MIWNGMEGWEKEEKRERNERGRNGRTEVCIHQLIPFSNTEDGGASSSIGRVLCTRNYLMPLREPCSTPPAPSGCRLHLD